MTDQDKNQVAKEYMHLIRWASFKFSKKLSSYIFNNQDFFDSGVEILTICINKWDEREFSPIEFGKYFKTALFRRMRQMQMKANTKKRKQMILSLDQLESRSAGRFHQKIFKQYKDTYYHDTFHDVSYNELVTHVKAHLTDKLELKLFSLLIDPPVEVLHDVVAENRKKMKIAIITDKRFCLNVLKYEPYIFSYLKSVGHNMTHCQYLEAMKRMKNSVKQILTSETLM